MEKFSFSKINTFYDCPYGYYLKYYKDIRTNKSHGTSEYGTFIHGILEKYEKKELDIKDLLKFYTENFDENVKSTFELNLGNGFKKNFYDSYFNDGLEYFLNFKGFNDWKILEVEYEFDLNMKNNFIFTGKIDLIGEMENGDIFICDHKSKKKFQTKKEQKKYARQLYLYSIAVKEKYGKFPKKLFFNMFRTGEIIEIDFDEKDYGEAVDWLYNSVEEISSEFDYSKNFGTFFCNNFCPYNDDTQIICSKMG